MNRTKLVSLTAIVLMLALLAGKHLFNSPDLPVIESWGEEVGADTIVLTRRGETTTLQKKDDIWYIGGTDWKASQRLASDMVNKLKDLIVYDRITESKQYARYDLDEDKRIQVIIKSGETELRNLYIGKDSPGMNQTYVSFPGDDAIYLGGNFALHNFNKSLKELRDSFIISLGPSSIKSCQIAFDDESYTLVNEEKSVKDDEGNESKQSEWKIEGASLADPDQNKLKALIAEFGVIQADGFAEKGDIGEAPVYLSCVIKAFEKDITLTMYDISDDSLIVKSSERPDYFTLPKIKVEGLRKSPADLERGAENN